MSHPTRVRGLKSLVAQLLQSHVGVAPHAGAWIEILRCSLKYSAMLVAPHAGAWIEILWLIIGGFAALSHPTRVRGLKFPYLTQVFYHTWSHPTRVRGLKSFPAPLRGRVRAVAPHAGAWIEISTCSAITSGSPVAPHAGAWIEIACGDLLSPPPRIVAPHAGAWIEIGPGRASKVHLGRRTPRGCVD